MRAPLALAVLILAAPALAQDRPAAEQQALVALARTLGESHALRQACRGPADQFWRERMMRLTDVEAPDLALEGRLRSAFNAGYAARRDQFPRCSPASREAEAASLAKGRDLAANLSRVTRRVDPDPFAASSVPDSVADEAPSR